MAAPLVIGEMVCFLDEYHWFRGKILSVTSKNVKISCANDRIYSKLRVKCAAYDEEVAVIWEMWRGRNGRGGYRVERDLYPELRKPAQQIHYNERLNEKAYGELA